MQEIIIGIDLGTTNSMASIVDDDGVKIIESANLTSFTPSIVFVKDSKLIVDDTMNDEHAERTKKENTYFYSFKKFMGRSLADFKDEQNNFSYAISAGENNTILLGKEIKFSPEALSAALLKHIKERAEKILNQKIEKAVITVPAYFDDAQRQATRNAAKIASLEAVRIINEPTAAALAYGLQEKKEGKVLVYDFGGGTLDVSILQMKKKLFKVLATNGNTNLGGDNIDQAIVDFIKKKFNITDQDKNINYELKSIAEKIKIDLSNQLQVEIDFQVDQKEYKLVLSREEFNDIITQIVDQTITYVKNALLDAHVDQQQIDEIVLVGGSTRVPLIREKLRDFFQKPLNLRINPDRAIAFGAGIQAFTLAGGKRDYLLLDVVPLSLGIETIGGTFAKLILKNSSIPAQKVETFSTSVDNQTVFEINIYQGEREFVKDCRLLGKFKIKIPPMPAGLPRLSVQFLVDTNGMLVVSAKEERSAQEAQIEVIPEHGLNQETIKQMIISSIDYAQADFEQRNLVEFRIKADQMLLGIEKNWKHANTFLNQEQRKRIEEQCQKVKQTIKEDSFIKLNQEMTILGDLTRDFSDKLISESIRKELT